MMISSFLVKLLLVVVSTTVGGVILDRGLKRILGGVDEIGPTNWAGDAGFKLNVDAVIGQQLRCLVELEFIEADVSSPFSLTFSFEDSDFGANENEERDPVFRSWGRGNRNRSAIRISLWV